MELSNLSMLLGIGAISGVLADALLKGRGFGLVGDMCVGIVGAFFGCYIFELLGVSVGGDITGSVITAVSGAMLLIVIIRLIKSL